MNREILRFVDTIHRDKQIDKEIIFVGIEQALVSAAQKKYGAQEDIVVEIDRETGEILASMNEEDLSPEDMGRIAALSGKQVLFQKIREAEREVVYEEYKPKVGQLLTGTIQSKKPGGVLILSLGGADGFLPRSEQSPAETFNEGDRIKVVLAEVNLMPNRVQLLCSRSSTELVRRLFELEIPEVADYVVEVKVIAREPGYRTKIAVTTYDSNVDCVGACVGVKGSRIRNIVDELFGEKIDIVRWNDSIEILIVEALRPAEIASLELDFESKSAIVFVKPDQQSLAIGRRGQNVRLASKLTGWELKITPITDEELQQMRAEGMESLADGMFNEGMSVVTTGGDESASPLDKLFVGGEEVVPVATEPVVEPSPGAKAAMQSLFVSPPDGGEPASEELPHTDDSDETESNATAELASPEGAESPEDGPQPLADTSSFEEGPPADGVAQSDGLQLEELPGVGVVTADRLREAGLDTPVKILELGEGPLAAVEGIGESKARQIIEFLGSQ